MSFRPQKSIKSKKSFLKPNYPSEQYTVPLSILIIVLEAKTAPFRRFFAIAPALIELE